MQTESCCFRFFLVTFCLNTAFLIVMPVTFDRSVSTYLLETLENKGSLTENELEKALIDDYVVRRGAVNRRIQEQIISGNLEKTDENIRLTPQGELFVRICKSVRAVFGTSVAP